MIHRLLRVAGPLLGVGVLILALKALHAELHAYHYRDIVQQLEALPVPRLLLAVGLAILSYGVLTGYDWIALRYVGSRLPYRTFGPAAFIATAVSNNVGFTWLSGGSVRLRFYTSQGLSTAQVTQVVGYITLSFWVGFLSVGGALFLFDPPPIPPELHLPQVGPRLMGGLLLGAVLLYAGLVLLWREPVRIRGWRLPMPTRHHLIWQVLVAGGDWLFAAATLYALLPGHEVSFHAVLGAFIVAQMSGLLSHVPGGIGVFETVVLLFLSDRIPKPVLLGTLVVYRAVYYLLPFALSVVLIGLYEVGQRRAQVQRLAGSAGRWASSLLPNVFALATFTTGVFLLVSSVTPALDGRWAWVDRVVPPPVRDVSHLSSGLVGAGLLLLARGIQRRLDGAYVLTVALLGVGAAVAVLRGGEFRTALVLAVLFVCFLPCHREFYRRFSLLHERFTVGWVLAILAVLVATSWLGFFVHRHEAFSSELLWRFVLHGEGPRFVRVSVGAAVVVGVFAVAHLLRALPSQPERPSLDDLATARDIVSHSPDAFAHRALLGDLTLLFNASRTGFVMSTHPGRGWVALGEPIAPESELAGLAWRWFEEVERHGAVPVFSAVRPEHLPLYLELGLSPQKVGEQARVALWDGAPEGSRQEWEGCGFEVIPGEGVGTWLAELERVAEDWCSRRGRGDVGALDARALALGPVALVRREGRVVAFASVWTGADREEVSVRLLRFSAEAPVGVMDWLVERLREWGRREGYRWLDLGLTPSADAEEASLSPTWSHLSTWRFVHGEHFEGLPSLRAFKQRFQPHWEPRYLVSPPGLSLPSVLEDVAAV